MLKNLTWTSAAKFYIAAVGLATLIVADFTNAPAWVHPVLGMATAIAVWLKGQTPVT